MWCLLLLGARAAAPIPTKVSDVGYELGTADAPVAIQVFGDFSCDDTANAWQTIVKPLLASYESSVSLVYHAFPLPYHHNSFDAAQAGRVMTTYLAQELPVGQAFVKAADALFAQQTKFMSWQTPNPTQNMSQPEVISEIFADIAVGAGVDRDYFLEAMGVGWNMPVFQPTRDAWKFGAALGVSATPTFTANGVFSDALDDWALANWTVLVEAGSS